MGTREMPASWRRCRPAVSPSPPPPAPGMEKRPAGFELQPHEGGHELRTVKPIELGAERVGHRLLFRRHRAGNHRRLEHRQAQEALGPNAGKGKGYEAPA